MELTANGGLDEFFSQQKKECLENRILVFNQEVDDNALEDIVLYILKWNMEDKNIPVEKRKPIKIYISSTGGDSFVAQNMVDVIVNSKTPVIGVGFSLTASAAYHIYLACHERVCFSSSIFLQHDGTISISNSSKKAQDTFQFMSEMEDRAKEFILSRTDMTEEFYDKIYDQEYWMYANKAKELGIVHKIIGEDCDIEYII